MSVIKKSVYIRSVMPVRAQVCVEVPRPHRSPGDEFVISPRIGPAGLTFLSVCERSQRLVTVTPEGRRRSVRVNNLFGVSLRGYLRRFFLQEYTPEAYRRIEGWRFLAKLDWQTSGRFLLIGSASTGWFAFELKSGVYVFRGAVCGATRAYGPEMMDHPGSLIRQPFFCVSAFFTEGSAAAFIGRDQDGIDYGQWYLYVADLEHMRLKNVIAEGRGEGFYYLKERQQFLIFRSENRPDPETRAQAPAWEQFLELADPNGQTLQTLDFSPANGLPTDFQPTSSSVRFYERGGAVLWRENRLVPGGKLCVLEPETGRLKEMLFQDRTFVYYDENDARLYAVSAVGSGSVTVYRVGRTLRSSEALLTLRGDVYEESVAVVGRLGERLILSVGGRLYAFSSDGKKQLLGGPRIK